MDDLSGREGENEVLTFLSIWAIVSISSIFWIGLGWERGVIFSMANAIICPFWNISLVKD